MPANNRRISLPVMGTIVIILSFILDQLSKYWVQDEIGFFSSEVVITPFFNLVFVINEGVSFGFLSDLPFDGQWPLIVLTSLLVIVIFIWMLKANTLFQEMSFGFIIGGALGNIIDRIIHGGVIDFLDFHMTGYHWPAFNLADTFIFIGVALLLFCGIKLK